MGFPTPQKLFVHHRKGKGETVCLTSDQFDRVKDTSRANSLPGRNGNSLAKSREGVCTHETETIIGGNVNSAGLDRMPLTTMSSFFASASWVDRSVSAHGSLMIAAPAAGGPNAPPMSAPRGFRQQR
jgi:hypothetical protein